MWRPLKNKIKLTREQALNRATRTARRVTFPNPVGTRSVVIPRTGRIVNRETGERVEDSYWTVHATKELPWAVRSRNRAANRVARASRKRNRSGNHS